MDYNPLIENFQNPQQSKTGMHAAVRAAARTRHDMSPISREGCLHWWGAIHGALIPHDDLLPLKRVHQEDPICCANHQVLLMARELHAGNYPEILNAVLLGGHGERQEGPMLKIPGIKETHDVPIRSNSEHQPVLVHGHVWLPRNIDRGLCVLCSEVPYIHPLVLQQHKRSLAKTSGCHLDTTPPGMRMAPAQNVPYFSAHQVS